MHTNTVSADNRGVVTILTKDLLFAVSIRNTVLKLGFAPRIVRSPAALVDALAAETPALAIVDLSTVGAAGDWDAIRNVKARNVSVLVFGPHKDVDGLRAAKAAGVTRVVSNGQFHREMGALIERYAAHDVDAAEPDPEHDAASSDSLPPGMEGLSVSTTSSTR